MIDCSTGVISVSNRALHWLTLREVLNISPGQSPPWLNPEEVVYWRTLKSDKRRGDWLLGRHAAKQLVAKLAGESAGRSLALDEIIILPHANGWPIVTLPHDYHSPPITLSISHSHDRAFCAASVGANQFLGADIEFIERRSSAFPDEYFTSLERQFLSAAPADQYTILSNAVWSGKEAVLKAIRRGLAEDTRLVSCLPHPLMPENPDWLPLRIVWSEDRIERNLPELAGYWRVLDGMVATLAVTAVTG